MNTPAYVMAVPFIPERAKTAAALKREHNVQVVWDETQNVMDTFRRLLAKVEADEADGQESGFLVLQDDIELADDWRARVEAAIAERPDTLIQFFSMRPADGSPLAESGWRKGETFISNLCVYIPHGMASPLLEYSFEFTEKYPQFKTADDFVVRYFLRSRRQAYWMHLPSLVQHQKWVSAINAKRPRNRQSHSFDGDVNA